mmetsp:Transcript_51375/g.122292  ORF Transcript_51375/g.122292 Transcript_51375/m.122292 type:complete len:213 (+) Transcript_51375:859-1497(+)
MLRPNDSRASADGGPGTLEELDEGGGLAWRLELGNSTERLRFRILPPPGAGPILPPLDACPILPPLGAGAVAGRAEATSIPTLAVWLGVSAALGATGGLLELELADARALGFAAGMGGGGAGRGLSCVMGAPGSLPFSQSSQMQLSEQRSPAPKHSQYFFWHLERRHRHPRTVLMVPRGVFTSTSSSWRSVPLKAWGSLRRMRRTAIMRSSS